jgi:hypothetical protein
MSLKKNYMRRYVRDGFRNKKGLVIARFVENTGQYFVDVGFSLKSAKDIDWNPVVAEDLAKIRLEQQPMIFEAKRSGDTFFVEDSTLALSYNKYMNARYPEMNPASRAMLFTEISSIVRDVANKPNRTCYAPLASV